MGPLGRLATLMTTLAIPAAVAHCGWGQCDDCAEPKPPPTILEGDASCSSSTPPLTRASLLENLAGDFVGRTGAAGSMTVTLEATTGVVTCEPAYSAGVGGGVPATVYADAWITIQSNGALPKGVLQGTVARSDGFGNLQDITFDSAEIDPKIVEYTPKVSGSKIRIIGRVHPDGTLSATVYEGSGSKAVPVHTIEP